MRVGQGFFSTRVIQIANRAMLGYTKFIDPAYAVVRRAIRFWML